jgi:hypothetical protein
MEASHKKRSIGWLIDKAMPAIMNCSVASTVAIFMHQVNMTPNNICEYYEGTEFAQSARWLAIIYRDYGLDVFLEVLNLVKVLNETNPQGVES